MSERLLYMVVLLLYGRGTNVRGVVVCVGSACQKTRCAVENLGMIFRHPLSTQRILLPHSPPQSILHPFVFLEQLYNHSTTVYPNVAYIAEFPNVAYVLDRSFNTFFTSSIQDS